MVRDAEASARRKSNDGADRSAYDGDGGDDDGGGYEGGRVRKAIPTRPDSSPDATKMRTKKMRTQDRRDATATNANDQAAAACLP